MISVLSNSGLITAGAETKGLKTAEVENCGGCKLQGLRTAGGESCKRLDCKRTGMQRCWNAKVQK